MPLFQQSVLKKYLGDLDKETLQQRWKIFTSHFHNTAIQQNILNANSVLTFPNTSEFVIPKR